MSLLVGHHRPASETPLKWRFADVPILAFFRLFALIFRHFAWRISFFRLAFFRLFVISLGVFSLFRLFAWRYFVLAPRHNARRKDEITKWHRQATIVKCNTATPTQPSTTQGTFYTAEYSTGKYVVLIREN